MSGVSLERTGDTPYNLPTPYITPYIDCLPNPQLRILNPCNNSLYLLEQDKLITFNLNFNSTTIPNVMRCARKILHKGCIYQSEINP